MFLLKGKSTPTEQGDDLRTPIANYHEEGNNSNIAVVEKAEEVKIEGKGYIPPYYEKFSDSESDGPASEGTVISSEVKPSETEEELREKRRQEGLDKAKGLDLMCSIEQYAIMRDPIAVIVPSRPDERTGNMTRSAVHLFERYTLQAWIDTCRSGRHPIICPTDPSYILPENAARDAPTFRPIKSVIDKFLEEYPECRDDQFQHPEEPERKEDGGRDTRYEYRGLNGWVEVEVEVENPMVGPAVEPDVEQPPTNQARNNRVWLSHETKLQLYGLGYFLLTGGVLLSIIMPCVYYAHSEYQHFKIHVYGKGETGGRAFEFLWSDTDVFTGDDNLLGGTISPMIFKVNDTIYIDKKKFSHRRFAINDTVPYDPYDPYGPPRYVTFRTTPSSMTVTIMKLSGYPFYSPTGCDYSFKKTHPHRYSDYPHEFDLTINCPASSAQNALINESYPSAVAITKPEFVNLTDSEVSYYSPEEPEAIPKWRSLRGSGALFEASTTTDTTELVENELSEDPAMGKYFLRGSQV